MSLTDLKARSAKPSARPYRLADEKGMYLEVLPAGGKYWRLKYRFAGKEKRLALGVYPDVPLTEARDRRDEARRLLRDGVDPAAAKRIAKRARVAASAESLEAVAREWYAKHAATWVPSHGERILRRFERDIFPYLGAQPLFGLYRRQRLCVADNRALTTVASTTAFTPVRTRAPPAPSPASSCTPPTATCRTTSRPITAS